MAVRVAPGIGCALNPSSVMTSHTCATCASVASAFMTISIAIDGKTYRLNSKSGATARAKKGFTTKTQRHEEFSHNFVALCLPGESLSLTEQPRAEPHIRS